MCGSGGTAALILHLRNAGRRMIGLEVTPQEKNTVYLLNRTLEGLGKPVGAVCRKETSCCCWRESSHTSSVIQHGLHNFTATQQAFTCSGCLFEVRNPFLSYGIHCTA